MDPKQILSSTCGPKRGGKSAETDSSAAGKVACVQFLVLKIPKLTNGDRTQRMVVAWWGEKQDGH